MAPLAKYLGAGPPAPQMVVTLSRMVHDRITTVVILLRDRITTVVILSRDKITIPVTE